MSLKAGVVFPFEEIDDNLSLLPLAARRALDVTGYRLSLEGYQSLTPDERRELGLAGVRDAVDPNAVDRVVKRSSVGAARIKPVPDPDALSPPEQLKTVLGAGRSIDAMTWSRMRALDRFALVHVMRKSIAHDDPIRLEMALATILGALAPAPAPRMHMSEPPPRGPSYPPPALPSGYPSRPPSAPGAWGSYSTEAPASVRPTGMPPQSELSHLTGAGTVHMVGVGEKPRTSRRATASGTVRMRPDVARKVASSELPKGEVFATARVAGILAAKRTPELVPLCHHVALTHVEVAIDVELASGIVTVTAFAEAVDRTGVEMEALTAVSVACLTIYDMAKALDREMVIGDLRVLSKSGGRSGNHDYDGG